MKKITFLFAALANLLFCFTAFGQNITQRGSATEATTNTTTLTINKPSGLQVGDVMLANIVQGDDDNNQTLGNASRSGWTLVRGGQFGNNGNNDWWGSVLYKIADATDVAATSFAFTLHANVSGDGAVGGLVAFYNVDVSGGVGPGGTGSGPFDVAAGALQGTGNSSSSTLTAPGITTVTNGAAVVMFGMGGDDNSFSGWTTTSPGTLGELFDEETGNGPDQCAGAAWALKTFAGPTGDGTATMSSSDRNGAVLIALKPVNPLPAPNLWSTASTDPIRAYTVNPVTGAILVGPSIVAIPSVSTAALGKNKPNPNDPDGYLYYLNRDDNSALNGVVTVYSVSPTGANNGSRGTIDMNGSSNEDFSYVRLGFDDLGRGWIIAGNASSGNIHIASFQGNGNNPISSVNTFSNISLGVVGGAVSEFQNGDLAISGTGTLFVVANISNGNTFVYTLNSLASPTTLTRRWTVVDQNNANFTGSVNGVAWTQSGSLHISTSSGIYFIDQATANTLSGTVQASLVPGSTSPSGLTDLASDQFPLQSTLPVRLLSFSGSLNNSTTFLNWEADNEQNFSHYEVERSSNGSQFTAIANKPSLGISGKAAYQYGDNLSNVSGNAFWYRLKIIDLDGQFKYSSVIMVRKDAKAITGITLNPNPVRGDGLATARFTASTEGLVTLRVLDLSGRVVLQQQNKIYQGNNSVPVSNADRLQPGNYVLQMINGNDLTAIKFTVVR